MKVFENIEHWMAFHTNDIGTLQLLFKILNGQNGRNGEWSKVIMVLNYCGKLLGNVQIDSTKGLKQLQIRHSTQVIPRNCN